jgi:hypothetical protein
MRSRSPIEMMVDKACGYDPTKDTTEVKEPLADEAKALLAVADAAVAWWRDNRPLGWNQKKHLAYPSINCTGHASETRLALAVTELIKLGFK